MVKNLVIVNNYKVSCTSLKDLDQVRLLGYCTRCNYPILTHNFFLQLSIFFTFLHFIYSMVEIENCFFQLSISTIESYCIRCNALGIAPNLNPSTQYFLLDVNFDKYIIRLHFFFLISSLLKNFS